MDNVLFDDAQRYGRSGFSRTRLREVDDVTSLDIPYRNTSGLRGKPIRDASEVDAGDLLDHVDNQTI